MHHDQLLGFEMKVQGNSISKQNALSNESKEINAKLHNMDIKINQLKKENNLLQSRVSIAEYRSTLLSNNHQKHT